MTLQADENLEQQQQTGAAQELDTDDRDEDELAADAEMAAGFKKVIEGQREDPDPADALEDDERLEAAPADVALEAAPAAKPAAPAAPAAQPAAQPAQQPADVAELVRTQVAAAEHRIRSDMGRQMSALKTTGQAAARETAAAGGTAPTGTAIAAAAAAGGERWKQLKEDFPEWAAAIEERDSALLERMKPQAVDIEALTQEIVQRVTQATPAIDPEAIVQHATTELKHPGWKKTIRTDDFKAWYATQPAEFRALGDSDSSADAIKVLDTYQAELTRRQKQQRTQSRLSNAVAPKGSTSTGPQLIDDEAAFRRGAQRVINR